MVVVTRSGSKLIVLLVCITLSLINYLDLNASIRKAFLADNQTIDGYDLRIEDNCYIIQNKFNGINQWGNAVYFNMFSIMYLLRNKASAVIIKANGIMPIGTRLTGVVFGPKADSYDENKCLEWSPELFYREQGAMQDIMDLRRDWDNLTESWPKNVSINMNPFVSDFGVEPSFVEVAESLAVDIEEVIVLHIRQGDVMNIAYPPRLLFIHSQPPCAYYEDAIETGYIDGTAFPWVLIITNTQSEEKSKNPCAQYLQDRYSDDSHPTKIFNYETVAGGFELDDRLPTEYNFLRIDLHILTEAINLAEGHSTFTMGTNMLNTKLKRNFVPANPSTINCVWPFHSTLNGDYVYTRQYYSKDLIQIQYLLPDYFGFNPTCHEVNLLQLRPWRQTVINEAKTWDIEKINITTKMLDYPRGKLLKYQTSDKPFLCASSVNPLMTANPAKWFAPCICEENVIDDILSPK